MDLSVAVCKVANKFEGMVGADAKRIFLDKFIDNQLVMDIYFIAYLSLKKMSHDDIFKTFLKDKDKYVSIRIHYITQHKWKFTLFGEDSEISKTFYL